MTDTQLFAFESDFVSSLRCIPMAVRLKLDVCGIKLSLRQWSRFTHEDRRRLLALPCRDDAEIEAYRKDLVELVALRANEIAKALADPPCLQWENPHNPPAVVTDYAKSVGLSPPSVSQWRALTKLQRFALIKLTRDNHDNVNFAPAMNEFGLATTRRQRLRAASGAPSPSPR